MLPEELLIGVPADPLQPDAQEQADGQDRQPRVPPQLAWVHSVRKPVLMKIDRARKELGWEPQYTAKQTLKETVEAFRAEEKVGAN